MGISDWSSDVCSSDLAGRGAVVGISEGDLLGALRVDEHASRDDVEAARVDAVDQRAEVGHLEVDLGDAHPLEDDLGQLWSLTGRLAPLLVAVGEIGRASCRERVCQYV